jgi:hypothetical protein
MKLCNSTSEPSSLDKLDQAGSRGVARLYDLLNFSFSTRLNRGA